MTDFIELYDEALGRSDCADILQRFAKSPHVLRGRTGHGVDPSKKNSWDLAVDLHAEWRDVVATLAKALAPHMRDYVMKHRFLLIGALAPSLVDRQTRKPAPVTQESLDLLNEAAIDGLIRRLYRIGPINLQRYEKGVGGYPWWHSEIYPRSADCETLHRVLFFQFYLNDVAEGGETEFHHQARAVAARAGRLLIAPAGFTHTHRGNVARSEDKYIATSWILFQRAEKLYPKP